MDNGYLQGSEAFPNLWQKKGLKCLLLLTLNLPGPYRLYRKVIIRWCLQLAQAVESSAPSASASSPGHRPEPKDEERTEALAVQPSLPEQTAFKKATLEWENQETFAMHKPVQQCTTCAQVDGNPSHSTWRMQGLA